MTTEHGPHDHQDDEQTPITERGQQPEDVGTGPYGGTGLYRGSAAYGYSAAMPPPPPPPPPMWAAGGMPGGYPGPAPAADQPGRKKSRRVLAVVAGLSVAAVAAGGAAWATSGGGALTTAQIATQTNPGLVDVISTLGFQHGVAEGTGMVLTSSGEVLTNHHVIADATSIKVRDVGNGRVYPATVVGYSTSNDVAVLQITGATGLKTVTIGNSNTAAVGRKVVALGNAGGRDGLPSVATGTITGLGAMITAQDQGSGTAEHLSDLIRTDAPIQPGDSGGPLLNSQGQVIGVDTAASTSSSNGFGTTADVTTMAFSIPINHALAIADQIEAGKASATVHIGATAFLGVAVEPGNGGPGATGAGVQIAGTIPGTAAAAAGLSAGDTILSVAGQPVNSHTDLQVVMGRQHPGEKVSLTWTDVNGQTHSATVTLTAGPTG
jgi:S1-C subfamily serine protease